MEHTLTSSELLAALGTFLVVFLGAFGVMLKSFSVSIADRLEAKGKIAQAEAADKKSEVLSNITEREQDAKRDDLILEITKQNFRKIEKLELDRDNLREGLEAERKNTITLMDAMRILEDQRKTELKIQVSQQKDLDDLKKKYQVIETERGDLLKQLESERKLRQVAEKERDYARKERDELSNEIATLKLEMQRLGKKLEDLENRERYEHEKTTTNLDRPAAPSNAVDGAGDNTRGNRGHGSTNSGGD